MFMAQWKMNEDLRYTTTLSMTHLLLLWWLKMLFQTTKMEEMLTKDNICTQYPTLVASSQRGRWRQTGSGNAQVATTICRSVVVVGRVAMTAGASCQSRYIPPVLLSNIRSPYACRPPSSRRRRPMAPLSFERSGLHRRTATTPVTASRWCPKDGRRRRRVDTRTTMTNCSPYRSASLISGTKTGVFLAHQIWSVNPLYIANQFYLFYCLPAPAAAS